MNNDEKDMNMFIKKVSTNDIEKAVTRRRISRTDTAAEVVAIEALDDSPESGSATAWAVIGKDIFYPCETTVAKLGSGQYTIERSDRGIYFQKKIINLDEILLLPDNNCDRVIKAIESFWDKEQIFRKHGFLWKRGILLWGPPGSGKTSLVQQLSKQIVDRRGISLYCGHPELTAHGLRLVRKIEPNRPIVVIIEDIDAIVRDYGEATILAMLDGELQIDNVVFVATTNYPELLDKRLVNRPSRFDEIIFIGMPSDDARGVYLKHKNKKLEKDEKELALWVAQTKGFSIAHLRELIVSVECLGNDFIDTAKRLRKMNEIKVSSEDNNKKMGFL